MTPLYQHPVWRQSLTAPLDMNEEIDASRERERYTSTIIVDRLELHAIAVDQFSSVHSKSLPLPDESHPPWRGRWKSFVQLDLSFPTRSLHAGSNSRSTTTAMT